MWLLLLFFANILFSPTLSFETHVIDGNYNVRYNITINKSIEYIFLFNKINVSIYLAIALLLRNMNFILGLFTF